MLIITDIESHPGFSVLSGVLLDPITGADYRTDVFRAFLVSDSEREIECEMAKPVGGHGTVSRDLFVGAFQTEIAGTWENVYNRDDEVLLKEVVENRVRLATRDNVQGVALPAFLCSTRINPPIGLNVTVNLEIEQLRDWPDVKVYNAVMPGCVLWRGDQDSLKAGMIFPVEYGSEETSLPAAIRVLAKPLQKRMEAILYCGYPARPPIVGDILKRVVSVGKLGRGKISGAFSAKVGELSAVEGAEKQSKMVRPSKF